MKKCKEKDKINKIEEEKNCGCANKEECTCGDDCTCENCSCENDKEYCCNDECNCDECNCTETCNCSESCDCNSSELSSDEEEILVLKNTIENLNNKVKQTQAELINYRKRKDEEVSNMMRFANKDLIIEILAILDNFERALNMKDKNPEFEKYSEGYELIYSHLIDTLKKFGVEEIDSLDKEFNPDLHEAVMIGCDEEKDDDIIIEVFNKGYTLKGRVIRPAKVRVNKLS